MKTPISIVLRMAEATEEHAIAGVLAQVFNCDQATKRIMNLPATVSAADVQRMMRHLQDLVSQPGASIAERAEAAVKEAVQA